MSDRNPYDLRVTYTRFRILVIGRANAGETTLLPVQRVYFLLKYYLFLFALAPDATWNDSERMLKIRRRQRVHGGAEILLGIELKKYKTAATFNL